MCCDQTVVVTRWCKLINEKAEEHKKMLGNSKMTHREKMAASPDRDEITLVRNRIIRKSQSVSCVRMCVCVFELTIMLMYLCVCVLGGLFCLFIYCVC